MGVDYESINSYDDYQYDPFLPLFFPIKKEQKEEKLFKPLNSKEKKTKKPQSRKNTLDEEREEKKKKN